MPCLDLAITGRDHMLFTDGRALGLEDLWPLLKEVSDPRRDRSRTPLLSTVPLRILADRGVAWREVRDLLKTAPTRRSS